MRNKWTAMVKEQQQKQKQQEKRKAVGMNNVKNH